MQAGKIGRERLARLMVAALVATGVGIGGQEAMAKAHHAAGHHVVSAPAAANAPAATDTPAASSAPAAGVAQTGSPVMSDAEKLRRLDIMLLVTGLRCRTTVDDFQPDFQIFETRHRRDLNIADHQLRLQFAHNHGTASAKAMDHINVEMSNVYGNGHPWMGCHDLKGVVQDLARMKGSRPLLTVATQLLASPMIVAQP